MCVKTEKDVTVKIRTGRIPVISPQDNNEIYEINLPQNFSLARFEEEAESGKGKFWQIKTEEGPGLSRFKGIIVADNQRKSWISIFLDFVETDKCRPSVFVTIPMEQDLSALEAAQLVMDTLGGITLYQNVRRSRNDPR